LSGDVVPPYLFTVLQVNEFPTPLLEKQVAEGPTSFRITADAVATVFVSLAMIALVHDDSVPLVLSTRSSAATALAPHSNDAP
jgi:hypothetical protein